MTSKWYFRKLNRVSYTPEWSAVKNHQKYIIQNITERLTIKSQVPKTKFKEKCKFTC